jgi:hypothetical protein
MGVMAAVLALTGLLGTDAAGGAVAGGCLPEGRGFLAARLRGDINADLDWHAPELACTGMQRPDGRGMRLRFSGRLPDGGGLAIVFAPPRLAEGESARAVPVNVTVLRETTGHIYGTRGEHRCTLDEVRQRRLPEASAGERSWEVEARGFCTEPARALDDSGTVLMTRFDFRGRVVLRDPPASAAAGPAGEAVQP